MEKRERKMKLIRNVSWIFVANLIVSFTKWLLLVIIAKLLSPAEVGAYSLAFAIGAPITLFANMKLRSLYITERKNDFSDYNNSRKLLSLISIIVLTAIGFFIYPQYFYIILFVGLMKVFDLQSDLYYALPHKEENMSYIAKLLILKHIITLITFFVSLIMTENLVFSLITQLTIQILFFYLIEKKGIERNYEVNSKRFNFGKVKKVILLGLPLGFVQMIFSFNVFYPRYLLEFFESTEILGYFSAIAYILVVGNILMNAVSQNFLPYLSREVKINNYKKFKRVVFIDLSLFSLFLGVLLILFSYLFGEIFLSMFYGKEYAKFVDILILVSFSIAINFISMNFDTALLAMRFISIQPKISVFVLVVNLIIGYILIRNYGIYGATYTIIITNSLQLLLRILFVNQKLNSLMRYDQSI
ncbi:oligosaccharide flippase family protein [Sporosarcina sp. Marseille-Q4943]|uniref:oligosaccharide flippase family protein n=1 Tax=Sporosarcina sp. Marseille-Q4943 TaxID=2942204 RepID=UPI00208DC690|nr:oligosaccharide flippase family protein [Sporosarcina sp. Marseille-Q4943]